MARRSTTRPPSSPEPGWSPPGPRGTHYRRRLEPPGRFHPGSFRTIDVGRPGYHKLVIACPTSSRYVGGRCMDGTRAQAELYEPPGVPRANPVLQIVNPKEDTAKGAKAVFKKFHWKGSRKAERIETPSGFPKHMALLGWVRVLYVGKWKEGYEPGIESMPISDAGKIAVATDAGMRTIYIGPINEEMEKHIGYYEMMYLLSLAYETPVKSKKSGTRWYHDFDDPPWIEVVEDWIVVTGPKLRITNRGIEG